MAGIYGDFLLAFPEQFQTLIVFSMTAQINGGWIIDEGTEQQVLGIYQQTGGKQIVDNNGNLSTKASSEFWSETPGLNGLFTNINGQVFRLKSDNTWVNEGGFVRYGLEKVTGNDGTEPTDTAWNFGSNNFG